MLFAAERRLKPASPQVVVRPRPIVENPHSLNTREAKNCDLFGSVPGFSNRLRGASRNTPQGRTGHRAILFGGQIAERDNADQVFCRFSTGNPRTCRRLMFSEADSASSSSNTYLIPGDMTSRTLHLSRGFALGHGAKRNIAIRDDPGQPVTLSDRKAAAIDVVHKRLAAFCIVSSGRPWTFLLIT